MGYALRMRSRLNNNIVKIACLQQDIIWEQPDANRQLVEEAFEGIEADILVVPETFTTGFSDTMAAMAEEPEGPTLQWARTLAKRHDALFAGTWTVRENGLVYNRLHWVYPDGSYGYYDKAHTFRMSSEASQLAKGRRQATFEWRGWRIKPAVCYDLRFPVWLRQSNNLDYDLMLVCANWPASRHEAWSTLLRARAIENLCYVAGVNRTGTDGTGIPYSGNCAVVDFKGHDIAAATPDSQTLITADLDREALDRFREHWSFHIDADPFELKIEN